MTGHTAPPDERQYSDLDVLNHLLRETRPFWGLIGVVFVLDLLATPVALLAPHPLKVVVDSVIGDEALPSFLNTLIPSYISASDASLLFVAVGLLVTVSLLTQLRGFCATGLRAYVGGRLILNLRTRLFSHAQRLSLAYHDTRGTSDSFCRTRSGRRRTARIGGALGEGARAAGRRLRSLGSRGSGRDAWRRPHPHGIEEHGTGHQLVRFRLWPPVSTGGIVAALTQAALAAGAAFDAAWTASTVLGTAAILIGMRMMQECAGAAAALVRSAARLRKELTGGEA